MDLHKDATQELRNVRHDHYIGRFNQLNGLLIGATEGVWSYLLTVNGGGAAAVLAYLATVGKEKAGEDVTTVLWLFGVGLFLVGVARAVLAHKFQSMVKGWLEDSEKYFTSKMPWSKLMDEDQKRVRFLEFVPWALGCLSFGRFFVGLFMAGRWLL